MKLNNVKIKKLKELVATQQISEQVAVEYLHERIIGLQSKGKKVSQGMSTLYKDLTGLEVMNPDRELIFDQMEYKKSCQACSIEQLDNRLFVTKSEIKRAIIISTQDEKIEEDTEMITIKGDQDSIVQALIQTNDPDIIRHSLHTMKQLVVELEEHLKSME